MSARFKPCPFCGGTDLGTRRVQESPIVDGMAVFCKGCSAVVVTRAHDEQSAAREWNTRAELPRPSLPPPRLPFDSDRLKPVSFCPACFASEENGSWGHVVESGYCTNCGNGSTLSVPRWAVESIREQASWVGKRYYPAEEDKERHAEIETLRGLMTEYPGRSVERDVDEDGEVHFNVKQDRPGGGYSTTMYSARYGVASAEQALERARTQLPFFTHDQLKAKT